MTLHKKIPFTWESKDYEIRVMYDEAVINVVTFYNNHPANGFRHMIKFSKQMDVNILLESDAINYLAAMCRRDIEENRWETVPQGASLP